MRETAFDSAGDPVERRCQRGGRTAIRSLKRARPQRTQFASDEDAPGEELPEEGFQPAQLLSRPGLETPSIPERASHFVLALALACRNIIEDKQSDSAAVSQLFMLLKRRGGKEIDQSELREGMTWTDDMVILEDLAKKCILAEETAMSLDFVYMVNCIQLRCKVIR
jgi:hypothetical protein